MHTQSKTHEDTAEAIQSITSSAAALTLAHSSPPSNADTPLLSSTLPTDIDSAVVSAGLPEPITHPNAAFHLDLQHGQVPNIAPISIPGMKNDHYMQQQATLSLPAFPVQQGIDPAHHSFSLPRQSPVQLSSLVTQNLSASGGLPQRLEYGAMPPQNNRVMYGPQAYAGMSRYPGGLMPPGAIGVNQQGQVFVNGGYMQGMPQSWPYSQSNHFNRL